MLDQTGLGDRADDQVSVLSGGNRQRVNIAIGLLAEPAVLLLDEPSSALDPRQRERLWEFLLALEEQGTAVVYATHDVQEAERHAHRVVVLADGELLFAGSPRELEELVGAPRPRLRGRLRRVPAPAGPLMRWLLRQGPPDPAPLAAAARAARDLPDRHRRADRVRALARPGQAARRVRQPRARRGEPARAGRRGRSTSRTTRTRCSRASTRSGSTARTGTRRSARRRRSTWCATATSWPRS